MTDLKIEGVEENTISKELLALIVENGRFKVAQLCKDRLNYSDKNLSAPNHGIGRGGSRAGIMIPVSLVQEWLNNGELILREEPKKLSRFNPSPKELLEKYGITPPAHKDIK